MHQNYEFNEHILRSP